MVTLIALALWLRAAGVILLLGQHWRRFGLTYFSYTALALDVAGNVLLAAIAWQLGQTWAAVATAGPGALALTAILLKAHDRLQGRGRR